MPRAAVAATAPTGVAVFFTFNFRFQMAASNDKDQKQTRDHDADNARDDAKNERPAERTQDGGTPRARSGNHTDHRRGDDDDRADMRKPGGEHRVPTTPNATDSKPKDANRSGSDSGK